MASGRWRLEHPSLVQRPSCVARPFSHLALALGVASASLSSAAIAKADTVEEARAAYERGAEAFRQKRYSEAAKELARADELAPNDVTLQEALRAAVKSDDPALVMAIVERAEKRPGAEALAKSALKAREAFASRAGKLAITCADARPCTARIDGSVVPIGVPRWVSVGERRVEIDVEGKSSSYTVAVPAGATLDWQPIAASSPSTDPTRTGAVAVTGAGTGADTGAGAVTAPATPPSAASSISISSAWFWLGVGVTAAVGAGTVASGIDTLDKHDLFIMGDDSVMASGKSAQARTNWLLGGTCIAAAGTVALGIFAFGGKSPSKTSASLSLSVTPGGASMRVRY